MTVYHDGWRLYANYLTENTPLSEREADILALKKTEHSTEEISEILKYRPETIEEYWNDVVEQWEQAQVFCSLMGPHLWGDDEKRGANEFDNMTWTLFSSAAMSYDDENRTRVELELYHGESNAWDYNYLLIEREIWDTEPWATKSTVERSSHGSNGLRGYIYTEAETLDEYCLRWALLHKAGIDPSAEAALSAEQVLDREVPREEFEAAEERALERVNCHTHRYTSL